jgi:hypothetical protein
VLSEPLRRTGIFRKTAEPHPLKEANCDFAGNLRLEMKLGGQSRGDIEPSDELVIRRSVDAREG